MKEATQDLYAQDYFEYLHNRGRIRRLVRKLYLHDISSYCIGPTLDFGCGVGELLAKLPEGSAGLEVNKVAVEYCKQKGFDVEWYEPEKDDYNLNTIQKGRFTTFTMNHVLEHIADPKSVVLKIFNSCYRLDFSRIVFTVPGLKGFKADQTHLVFIDKKFFESNGLFQNSFYRLSSSKHFPVNNAGFGRYFRHNEFRLVFDKIKPFNAT